MQLGLPGVVIKIWNKPNFLVSFSVLKANPNLEINLIHPLVEKLKTKVDESVVNALFEQTVLAESGQLKDPAEFVKRMNKLIN